MNIGDRVKYSDNALRHDFDYYLKQGNWDRKQKAKEYYENKKAMRGTITGLCGVLTLSKLPSGVKIDWDNGIKSETATYMITLEGRELR
jgi:hypothetical protein